MTEEGQKFVVSPRDLTRKPPEEKLFALSGRGSFYWDGVRFTGTGRVMKWCAWAQNTTYIILVLCKSAMSVVSTWRESHYSSQNNLLFSWPTPRPSGNTSSVPLTFLRDFTGFDKCCFAVWERRPITHLMICLKQSALYFIRTAHIWSTLTAERFCAE